MSVSPFLKVSTPNDLEIKIERLFHAEPDLVFECYIRPDLVRRWMTGPGDWWVSTCEIDSRPGGSYRYVWSGPNGESMGLKGSFHEVVRPSRLLSTEVFDEDYGMGKMLSDIAFQAEGRYTRLEQKILYETKAQRDASIEIGMTDGMEISFGSLDRLLVEITEA